MDIHSPTIILTTITTVRKKMKRMNRIVEHEYDQHQVIYQSFVKQSMRLVCHSTRHISLINTIILLTKTSVRSQINGKTILVITIHMITSINYYCNVIFALSTTNSFHRCNKYILYHHHYYHHHHRHCSNKINNNKILLLLLVVSRVISEMILLYII